MKNWNFSHIKMVSVSLSAATKEAAVRELAALLKESPQINNFEKFVTDVLERERRRPTGVGHETAFPHARTDSINKFVVVFGRSGNGIDFGAIDKKPARLIFLLEIPKFEIRGYLQVLGLLSRSLENEKFRQKLLEAKDEKEIRQILVSMNEKQKTNAHRTHATA